MNNLIDTTNKDELEKLKAEIKQDILRELEAAKATRRIALGMELVKSKWMYGPNPRYRYSDSTMDKAFGNKQHVVWDAVRILVRVIFSKDNQSQLSSVDQESLKHVCEDLFETVYRLRQEVAGNDESISGNRT